jgi:iron complex transport system substrate-binding protein
MPVLLLFCLLRLLSVPVQDKPAALYDDLGHLFSLGASPRRIVSMAPNITEILFALGLGDRVVGVTRYCDYPPEAARREKIGGLVDPSIEKIQALHPDLIIAFRGNPIGILNKLKNLRFPVFILDTGRSLDDLFLTIEKVAAVTGEEKTAANIIDSLRKKRLDIQKTLSTVEKTPRVFLSVYGRGLWTCGQESYLNSLLTEARGANISAGIRRRWLNLSREELIHRDPEVIIIMTGDESGFARAKEWLLADSRLKTISAIRRHEIHFLDENVASRFGPRLIDALDDVARILHPEKFGMRP